MADAVVGWLGDGAADGDHLRRASNVVNAGLRVSHGQPCLRTRSENDEC